MVAREKKGGEGRGEGGEYVCKLGFCTENWTFGAIFQPLSPGLLHIFQRIGCHPSSIIHRSSGIRHHSRIRGFLSLSISHFSFFFYFKGNLGIILSIGYHVRCVREANY